MINGNELPQLKDQPCLFLQLIILHFLDTHVIEWRAYLVLLSKVGVRTYPGIASDLMKDKLKTSSTVNLDSS